MSASRARILYIDDDPGLCRLVQKDLERQGYVVEIATDGARGLARIAQGGIDVVALDHYMPNQDGLETLASIRNLAVPPPVIYVTAMQEGRVAVAALKAGAADYVAKDVQGEFLALLQRAIDSAFDEAMLRRDKEAAEAEVRAARDLFEALANERALLLHEVDHRVSNSLQIVASILGMQASTASNQEVKDALSDANKRVLAVGQIHRRLYTSDDIQSVSLEQYLSALVQDLRQSSDVNRVAATLSLAADPIKIDPDRAIAIGIVVTELVINSLKHAYPSGHGPIRIGLHELDLGRAMLSVEDEGVGCSPTSLTMSKGLGQRIVRAMTAKLGATLCQETSGGCKVTVAFDVRGGNGPTARSIAIGGPKVRLVQKQDPHADGPR
jgi:two-component sensor histidine kinase